MTLLLLLLCDHRRIQGPAFELEFGVVDLGWELRLDGLDGWEPFRHMSDVYVTSDV